jgi:predicted RNase H-like nuclease (RuvC/YqgF family)
MILSSTITLPDPKHLTSNQLSTKDLIEIFEKYKDQANFFEAIDIVCDGTEKIEDLKFEISCLEDRITELEDENSELQIELDQLDED